MLALKNDAGKMCFEFQRHGAAKRKTIYFSQNNHSHVEKKTEKAGNIAAYDKGTDHENDMVEEVLYLLKRLIDGQFLCNVCGE